MTTPAGSPFCGVVDATPAWGQLLDQEGLPWERVSLQGPLPVPYTVIVADRPLLPAEGSWLRSFLASGGAVIGAARFLGETLRMPVRPRQIRWLIDPRDDAPPWVDLLDVETLCHVPREANTLRTNDGDAALFAAPWGGGVAVVLPFDVRDLWQTTSACVRMFPARRERLPYERVAAAGRTDLLRLLHCALAYLHRERGVPYARLWPFPDASPGVVAFRLDTDRAPRARIDEFEKLSSDLGFPFTWFVDTASHEGWLDRFAAMPGQEIGVHCFRHRSHATPAGYLDDVREARRRLEEAGVTAEAYAAPFGIWNPALGQALEDLMVPYSSEFGIGYDTLPFYPERPGRVYPTLQVPVHPVSTGALRRVGWSPADMERYFSDVVARKTAREQPLVLYDHPVHGYVEVCRTALLHARGTGARPCTLGAFARWWQRRSAVLHGVVQASPADGLTLHLSAGAEETLAPLAVRPPVRVPDGIRSTREFDLRTAIGAAFQALLRRRQA